MTTPLIDVEPVMRLARIFSYATRKKLLEAAGKRMGAKAESFVPDYPKASGKPLPKIYTRDTVAGKKVSPFKTKFKTAGQAYFVLKLGEKGGIPYQRSGLLGRSITSAISDLTGSSVTVRTGTALRYAPLVIGDDKTQSNYHKKTWWQLHSVMEANRPAIEAEGQKTLLQGVEKELNS